MTSPKQCPYCYAKALERQPQVGKIILWDTHRSSDVDSTLKVKPWVCRHCGIVLFFTVEES